jgi:hypothetical protein
MSSKVSSPTQAKQAPSNITALPAEDVPRWRENPERVAWAIFLASFTVFLALVIMIPLGAQYFVRYYSASEDALLEPTLGTLLLYTSPSAEPIAVTTVRDDITEGSRIVAAEESTQGTLGLISKDDPSDILGSIQMYPGTDLEVTKIRRPYFDRSSEPYQANFHLNSGQARIFSNTGDQRPLRIELSTPHGIVELGDGSYRVSVDDERTDLTARSGSATLLHEQDGAIVVNAGERAWMTQDELIDQVKSAEQNLIRNGDFTESMLDTWNSYAIADNVSQGSVRIIERDGRRVAHFIRQGEENVPTEVGITQEIDKEVNVYDELRIELDLRLMHQSLPGAGYLSSEFPMRVEIEYTDIYGKDLRWGHGFYFREPEDPNWKIINGEKVPAFNWYKYRSPNLMELLQETRPARINSIRIYASGWNYQGMVSEAYLFAQ